MVYFDDDSSVFDYGILSGEDYQVYTIDYQVTDPTGISEQASSYVALWPNPALNFLCLEVAEGTSISVFDVMGRMVKQERYEGKIDVRDLTPGIYAIKANGITVRFVKE